MTTSLQGRRILLTRPARQGEALATRLRALKAHVDCFAGLQILPHTPSPEEIARLDTAQWVIFVSANAVRGVQALGWFNHPHPASLAAIGEATACTLKKAHAAVTLLAPPPYNSEALLSLEALQTLEGQKVVIARGQSGREFLAQQLRQRGATVDYLGVYRREPPTAMLSFMALPHGTPDILCITSAEIGHNLTRCVASPERQILLQLPFLAGNARIAEACAGFGYTQCAAVSDNPGDEAMLDALRHYFEDPRS